MSFEQDQKRSIRQLHPVTRGSEDPSSSHPAGRNEQVAISATALHSSLGKERIFDVWTGLVSSCCKVSIPGGGSLLCAS